MERTKDPKRPRWSATRLPTKTASATSRVGLAKSTEVANYRSSLRLLPCRVYSAILTAIWETVPTGERMRTELVR